MARSRARSAPTASLIFTAPAAKTLVPVASARHATIMARVTTASVAQEPARVSPTPQKACGSGPAATAVRAGTTGRSAKACAIVSPVQARASTESLGTAAVCVPLAAPGLGVSPARPVSISYPTAPHVASALGTPPPLGRATETECATHRPVFATATACTHNRRTAS